MVVRFGWLTVAATLVACADTSSHQQAIDVVGTPFYVALKIPVCAATVVIAAPLAAIAGLADPSPNAAEGDPKSDLDHGIRRNCGPPYVLSSGRDAGVQ